MKSKKGSFIDVIASMIVIFIFIVLIVAIGIAYSATAGSLEDTKVSIGVESYSDSADLVINQSNKYPAFWDFLILLVAFGLWIGLMISSFILGNNPVFLVSYVAIMIILLIFGSVMQMAGRSMLENSAMSLHFVDYPITQFLLNNFLIYSLFIIVTTGIVLYLKIGGEGG